MTCKILLIEDNPDDVLLTKKIIEKSKQDYQVDSASEAKIGLKKIKENDYDLVLCDYRLPGQSGLDILRASREGGRDLPFVVVTSVGSEKIAVEFMKEGAYDYLVKDSSYEDTIPLVIKRTIDRYNIKKEKEFLEEKLKQAGIEWEVTFNSIRDLVSIHDPDYRIVRINKAFADEFGLKPEDIIGKYCYEIFHKSDAPLENCPHKKSLDTKQSICAEFFEEALDNYFEVSVSPIFNQKNKIINTVHIAKNITERKKLERMKENLVRDVSHGLKTPLAMAQMAANLCQQGIAGNSMDLVKTAHRIGSDNLVKLRKDIDKILQVYSLDRRKQVPQPELGIKKASLSSIIDETLEDMHHLIEMSKLELKVDIAKEADQVGLAKRDAELVVSNIIENAVRFTKSGSITIVAKLKEQHSQLTIADTGSGIPKEDQGKLFERFYKRHAAIEGAGLGLSICKEILEMYKGSITIKSKGVNKGTSVIIEFPRRIV